VPPDWAQASRSEEQNLDPRHKFINLPFVLYRCDTWSHTLREDRRLKAFENRVLKRIFGTKTKEVEGGWRRLHNEGLQSLYAS